MPKKSSTINARSSFGLRQLNRNRRMEKVSSLLLLLACVNFSFSYNGELFRIDDQTGLIIGGEKCRYPCSLKKKRDSPSVKGSHTISALDCRFPKNVKNGLLQQICNRDQEVQKTEAKEVLLLQYSQ